jgi:glycine/D-amino acid oxidase-like deaminating enzyme
LQYEKLSAREGARRFPQISFECVSWAILEKDAGYLSARRACQSVVEGFVVEGGEYRERGVTKFEIRGGEMHGAMLSDGSRLAADAYVFACGPWLGMIFPEVLGNLITPTRQEVYFFGPAAGDGRFAENALPVVIDHGERLLYAIPANQGRGFKLGDDTRGPNFDPTSGDRATSQRGIRAAREYLAFRFPGLKNAPLVESRVCQYEQSRDGHFILDRHPAAGNVWLIGGGSGHGFKHGPRVGEMAAKMVVDGKPSDALFSLSRFSRR